MPRLLAIDYGTKRTGIAVSDPLQLIANGLTTVRSHELLQFLEQYTKTEQVETFIIGMPRTLRNEDAENTKYVKIFAKQCAQKFPHIPIVFIDERFTSTMAHQTMRDAGLRKTARQNKELVDSISATIILQSYMEQKK
ncbi:MAG: Holliday junction resolvase RuvX [Bacteroidales bacterium]|jgi:putative Holliday junction resolvase|nr:Holliday junction resolvase RuvX [Bacteroidales bacterium]